MGILDPEDAEVGIGNWAIGVLAIGYSVLNRYPWLGLYMYIYMYILMGIRGRWELWKDATRALIKQEGTGKKSHVSGRQKGGNTIQEPKGIVGSMTLNMLVAPYLV